MEKFVGIFNNSMELICLGLYEKLQNKSEQGDHKYSPLLKKALDKFSLYSLFTDAGEAILPYDETALITTFNFPITDLIDKLITDFEIVQEVLAQINWYSNLTLLDKVKTKEEHIWYVKECIENGWSRNVLVHQIESQLLERQSLVQCEICVTQKKEIAA